MREQLFASLFLFVFLIDSTSVSANTTHYVDLHANKLAEFHLPTEIPTQKIFENDCERCKNLRDELSYIPFDNATNKEEFELSTELRQSSADKNNKITVLNVTISKINFHKLTISHEDLAIGTKSNCSIYCQTIELGEKRPEKLIIILPVCDADNSVIQFYAEGEDNFFKQYHYKAPLSFDIANNDFIEPNRIFAYVDTTLSDSVILHVQPLPENFNITLYIVTFRCSNRLKPGCTQEDTFNLSSGNLQYKRTEFQMNGEYYSFVLTPVSNGQSYASSSTVDFIMKKPNKLVIMIVSSISIPIVLFFALYLLYRFCTNPVSRKPNCLLVYSATHDAHIDVMEALAMYLRACNINAMLDILDVPNRIDKNPHFWYNEAFLRADIVVVVTSPPPNESIRITRTLYRNVQNIPLTLIQAHTDRKDKQYLAVRFPYCEKYDLPNEALGFKLLKIPERLKKLVNKIHGWDCDNLYHASTKELGKTIIAATNSILYGIPYNRLVPNISIPINDNTRNVIEQKDESDDDVCSSCKPEDAAPAKCSYATDIASVNLLKYEKKTERN